MNVFLITARELLRTTIPDISEPDSSHFFTHTKDPPHTEMGGNFDRLKWQFDIKHSV
jgi:hypothetical protein